MITRRLRFTIVTNSRIIETRDIQFYQSQKSIYNVKTTLQVDFHILQALPIDRRQASSLSTTTNNQSN
ncbi:hypothetical protein FD07_GL000816 [Levilactobacillus parabrevis ATCC 53295]|uniref:Uncharacterized protein n=1 Tax=Levilactobacillus parabrevis ATCC 53295 TaxID=1267003 RepID=A0A0R1GWK8_9LACO|nr:hypothetical protein FD07_GL000816 [Levilactobacillus parabrevis ATCC 53295]